MMTEQEKYEFWCELRPAIIAEVNAALENKLDAMSDQIANTVAEGNSKTVILERFGANLTDGLCRLFQEHFDQEDFCIPDEEYWRVMHIAEIKTKNETGCTDLF